VHQAFARQAGLNTSGLEVTTSSGIVTLRGSRPNFREIDRLLSIALMVEGVREVKSEMTINGKEYSSAWSKNAASPRG